MIIDFEKQQHPKNFKIIIFLLRKTIVHIHLALELIKYCCLEQNKGRQEEEEELCSIITWLINFLGSVNAHKTDLKSYLIIRFWL